MRLIYKEAHKQVK